MITKEEIVENSLFIFYLSILLISHVSIYFLCEFSTGINAVQNAIERVVDGNLKKNGHETKNILLTNDFIMLVAFMACSLISDFHQIIITFT